jgi:hypothetical protein
VTRVQLAVALGTVSLLVALMLVLLHAPSLQSGTNGASNTEELKGILAGDVCQGGETLPAQTSAMRMYLRGNVGPRMTLKAYAGGRVIAAGNARSGWTGDLFTVSLRPLSTTAVHDVRICTTATPPGIILTAFGKHTSAAQAATDSGKQMSGRVRIEFLKPGKRTWLSYLLPIVRHMGMSRAFSGSGIVVVLLLLMAGAIGLSFALILREIR